MNNFQNFSLNPFYLYNHYYPYNQLFYPITVMPYDSPFNTGEKQTKSEQDSIGNPRKKDQFCPENRIREVQNYRKISYRGQFQKQMGQHHDIRLNQSEQLRSRSQKFQKKTKYLKKNTESNISNQILSFLSNQHKSYETLSRILKHMKIDEERIVKSFYLKLKKIQTEKKKYMNKKKILEISTDDDLQTEEYSELAPVLFKKLIRIMIKIFLTQFCTSSILTSKKLYKEASIQHLERRRQIYQFLMKSYSFK